MKTRTGMRAPVRCARQPLAYIIVIVIMIAIGLVFFGRCAKSICELKPVLLLFLTVLPQKPNVC